MLDSFFTKKIDERITALSGKVSTLKSVSDEQAEMCVENFIVKARSRGETEVSVLEIMANTGVPSGQVSKVLQKYIGENRLQEA